MLLSWLSAGFQTCRDHWCQSHGPVVIHSGGWENLRCCCKRGPVGTVSRLRSKDTDGYRAEEIWRGTCIHWKLLPIFPIKMDECWYVLSSLKQGCNPRNFFTWPISQTDRGSQCTCIPCHVPFCCFQSSRHKSGLYPLTVTCPLCDMQELSWILGFAQIQRVAKTTKVKKVQSLKGLKCTGNLWEIRIRWVC